jgi:hypothetical protein
LAAVRVNLGSNVQSIAAYKEKLAALSMAARAPNSIAVQVKEVEIKRPLIAGAGAVQRA